MEIKEFRKEVQKLLKFFEKEYEYPETIKMHVSATITNVPRFVETHVIGVKKNSENIHFRAELDRLIWLRKYVQENNLKCLGERVYVEKSKSVSIHQDRTQSVQGQKTQAANLDDRKPQQAVSKRSGAKGGSKRSASSFAKTVTPKLF